MVINLHICLCALPGAEHTLIWSASLWGGSESVQSATRRGAGRPGPAGIRFCSRRVKTLHIHALPFDLGRSDCKCLLKILGPRHLATKQENYKTSQLIFLFLNKHKIQEFQTVGHEISFRFLFLFLPYIVKP